MSTYRVADGHDVALGSLTVIDPQPRSDGIQVTRRLFAASGAVIEQGKYVELRWDALLSVSEYQTVLSAFGVQSALTNDVTVYVRDEAFDFVRMNGTAIRPRPGSDVFWRFFPRRIVILVRDLEAAS